MRTLRNSKFSSLAEVGLFVRPTVTFHTLFMLVVFFSREAGMTGHVWPLLEAETPE